MSYNKKMILNLLCAISLSGVATVASAMEKQVALKNKPVLRTEQWTPQAKDVLAKAQIQEESHLTVLGKMVKNAEKKDIQPLSFDLTPTAGDYLRVAEKSERFSPRPVINDDVAPKKVLTEASAQKRQNEQNAYKAKAAQVLSERKSEIDEFDTFELVVEEDKPRRSHRNKSHRKPAEEVKNLNRAPLKNKKPQGNYNIAEISPFNLNKECNWEDSLRAGELPNLLASSNEQEIDFETYVTLPGTLLESPVAIQSPLITVTAAPITRKAPTKQSNKTDRVKENGPSQNILSRAKRQQLAEATIDSEFLPQSFATPAQSPTRENPAALLSARRPAALRDRQEDDRIDVRTLTVIENAHLSDKTVDDRFFRNFIDGKK